MKFPVLVVEDELPLREGFSIILQVQGHPVQAFSDGLDVLDYFRSSYLELNHYILLIDQIMLNVDAKDVIKHIIRSPSIRKKISIILMYHQESSQSTEGIVRDVDLVKPFTKQTLLETIEKCVQTVIERVVVCDSCGHEIDGNVNHCRRKPACMGNLHKECVSTHSCDRVTSNIANKERGN
jgi:CheY-like chemotaxis protein